MHGRFETRHQASGTCVWLLSGYVLCMQGLEKYLMTRIHHKTFAVAPLDRERDEALSLRMAALDFVGASHLDIPAGLLDGSAPVHAMKELHKVNEYKARRCITLEGTKNAAPESLHLVHLYA